MSLLEKKKFYFIGIGGIGMSGIAEILHEMKFKVSGSEPVVGTVRGIVCGVVLVRGIVLSSSWHSTK